MNLHHKSLRKGVGTCNRRQKPGDRRWAAFHLALFSRPNVSRILRHTLLHSTSQRSSTMSPWPLVRCHTHRSRGSKLDLFDLCLRFVEGCLRILLTSYY
jgi:hypothetical protein